MELRHLQHFIAVAEELSFTNAARRVHIVQSALSASVRSLERDLGTELFTRTGHSVLLTEWASPIDRGAQGRGRGGGRARRRRRGRGRPTWTRARRDPAGPRASRPRRRPDPLSFPPSPRADRSARRARRVRGACQVGAERPARRRLRQLARRRLSTGRGCRCARPRNPGAGSPGQPPPLRQGPHRSDELDGEAFVDYPAGWGIRRSVDRLFADRGLSREIVVEVADCRTAFELAVGGLGIAFVIPSTTAGGRNATLHQVTPAVPFEVSIVTGTQPPPTSRHPGFRRLGPRHFERGAMRL